MHKQDRHVTAVWGLVGRGWEWARTFSGFYFLTDFYDGRIPLYFVFSATDCASAKEPKAVKLCLPMLFTKTINVVLAIRNHQEAISYQTE